jgi:cell division protein FtsW (lipid II flippase)
LASAFPGNNNLIARGNARKSDKKKLISVTMVFYMLVLELGTVYTRPVRGDGRWVTDGQTKLNYSQISELDKGYYLCFLACLCRRMSSARYRRGSSRLGVPRNVHLRCSLLLFRLLSGIQSNCDSIAEQIVHCII